MGPRVAGQPGLCGRETPAGGLGERTAGGEALAPGRAGGGHSRLGVGVRRDRGGRAHTDLRVRPQTSGSPSGAGGLLPGKHQGHLGRGGSRLLQAAASVW